MRRTGRPLEESSSRLCRPLRPRLPLRAVLSPLARRAAGHAWAKPRRARPVAQPLSRRSTVPAPRGSRMRTRRLPGWVRRRVFGAPLFAVRGLGGTLHGLVAPAEQQGIRRANAGAQQSQVGCGIEQARIPASPARQQLLDLTLETHAQNLNEASEDGNARNSRNLRARVLVFGAHCRSRDRKNHAG